MSRRIVLEAIRKVWSIRFSEFSRAAGRPVPVKAA
jgi:hypothetical protein